MGEPKFGLSIAGLDPSGGAGILADVKTFEALGVHGFGVSTAITYQNEVKVSGLSWLNFEQITMQLDPLFEVHKIGFAKIGLIENWKVLKATVAYLKGRNPGMVIVWDPILSSSSGYMFHGRENLRIQIDVLDKIDLFTPNTEEMQELFPKSNGSETAIKLSSYCSVLLKGGHNLSDDSNDVLYQNGSTKIIHGRRLPFEKHGTGCVLSAAIVAHLALGNNMEESCCKAKNYIENYINSNTTLLGSHSIENAKTYS